jgi:hypothetical protein
MDQQDIQKAIDQAIAPLASQIQAIQASIAPLQAEQAQFEAMFGGVPLSTVVGTIHQNTTQGTSQLTQPLDPISIQIVKGLIGYPVVFTLKSTEPATTGNYTHFFVADRAYSILSITEVHGTAGTDGSAVTLQVQKLTGTTAIGSGTSILSTAFNLKATANTPQYPGLVATGNVTNIVKGDRIGLKLTGTPTSVADMIIVELLRPA